MRSRYIITIGFILVFVLMFSDFCYSFWTWPVDGRELQNIHGLFTSEFGPNAYSTTQYRFHDGIDIDTYDNQNIYAAEAGEVIFVGNDGSYGLTIRIEHSDGEFTRYCHMNTASVNTGDNVIQGQIIGTNGESKRGTHLHFERWQEGDDWENGKKRHPLKYMNYSSDEIDISFEELGGYDFKFGIETPTNRLHVDRVEIIFNTGKSLVFISIPYSPPDPAVIPFHLNPTPDNVYIDFEHPYSNWECRYYVEPDYWLYTAPEYTIYYRFTNFINSSWSSFNVFVYDANNNEIGFYDSSMGTEPGNKIYTQLIINNCPNPFYNQTIISYNLKNIIRDAKIEIYNIKGQKVKILQLSHEQGAGEVVWNGTNEEGDSAPGGIYFQKLVNNNKVIDVKKMLLIK